MNHYPRHVGDFIRDTVGLSLAERGAYTALLDQYYASEKPLPLDARERYRMTGATSKADKSAVDYIVTRYFREQPDGWHQKRADKEISAFQKRTETARDNGRRGGRTVTEPLTETEPDPNQTPPTHQANQEPVTNNQNQRSKTKPSAAAQPEVCVPQEVWQAFRDSRRALKAPLTPRGEAILADKLRGLADAGNDPTKVVEQSIERGWKGLFPLDQTAQRSQAKTGRAKVNEAIWGNRKANDDAIDGTAERIA